MIGYWHHTISDSNSVHRALRVVVEG